MVCMSENSDSVSLNKSKIHKVTHCCVWINKMTDRDFSCSIEFIFT